MKALLAALLVLAACTSQPAKSHYGANVQNGTIYNMGQGDCTPVQVYGIVGAGVVKDAGGLFYSAGCYNRGSTLQYLQLQAGISTPLQDAGPAVAQWPIPAGGTTLIDHQAPSGVDFPSGIAFDVSATTQFYTPDAGNVDCFFCYN